MLTFISTLVLDGQALATQPTHRRLAVLEFSGRNLEADVLGAFSDAVRGGAVEGLVGRDVKVMTRENMMVLLRDMGKSECAEGDCEVETARNIGADFVVSASVVHIENSFVITLKLHESKEGGLLATDAIQANTLLETLSQLRQHGRDLLAINIGPTGAPTGAPRSTVATPAPAPRSAPAPEVAPVAEVPMAASAKADATPSFRRGILFMPQVGIEYPVINSAWRFGTGYRFGALLGGHLNKDYSFGVDAAFAMGDNANQGPFMEGYGLYGTGGERFYHLDGSLALLRHVALPFGEFLAGPKLGASYVMVKDQSSSFSPKIGVKACLLWVPSRSSVALGLVMDLTYMRLDHLEMSGKRNTLLTSISAAILF